MLSSFVSDLQASSVYRTKALYLEDQADFFNMVVTGGYEGTPSELLSAVHHVETSFGRDRTKEIRNGPRSLDVDIELFGDVKINGYFDSGALIIPHERLYERAFVLVPLIEVLSDGTGVWNLKPFEDALACLPEQRIDTYMDVKNFTEMYKWRR